MDNFRIEHDSMGEVKVPADKYWAAQTERSHENFKIGVDIETMPREITKAFGYLKKAAARANNALKPEKMTSEKLTAIEKACDEVISGSLNGVEQACRAMKEAGAKRALKLPVGGAFHSPLMHPAAERLEKAILTTKFNIPKCPLYQNVSAKGETDPQTIQQHLLQQLTSPVRWTQSVEQMIADGATTFYEFGPGDVLKGLIRKINSEVEVW